METSEQGYDPADRVCLMLLWMICKQIWMADLPSSNMRGDFDIIVPVWKNNECRTDLVGQFLIWSQKNNMKYICPPNVSKFHAISGRNLLFYPFYTLFAVYYENTAVFLFLCWWSRFKLIFNMLKICNCKVIIVLYSCLLRIMPWLATVRKGLF